MYIKEQTIYKKKKRNFQETIFVFAHKIYIRDKYLFKYFSKVFKIKFYI